MNYCLLTDVYGNDFNNVNYTNNNTNYTLLNKKHTEPSEQQQNINNHNVEEKLETSHEIHIQKQHEDENHTLLKQQYNKNIDEINNKIQELTKKINLQKQKIIENKQKHIKNNHKTIKNKNNIQKYSKFPKHISSLINQKEVVIHNIIYGLLLVLCFDLYLQFVNK